MGKNKEMSENKPFYSIQKNSIGWEWSETELEILKNSAGNKTIQEISEILGRPKRSIINKASSLKISISDRKKWTQEDDDVLSKLAGIESIESISNIIKRSEISIKSRASKLNISLALKNQRWTNEEKAKLRAISGKKPVEEIVKILKRSKSSIQTMASSMNLSLNVTRNQWSDEEIRILSSLNGKTKEYASTVLPFKSSEAITAKAKSLKIDFVPMREKHVVKKENSILPNVSTLYALHQYLRDREYPVGKYQGQWLKSEFLNHIIKLDELEKVDIYINNGAGNNKKNFTYTVSDEQVQAIKDSYYKLKEQSIKPKHGYRCYDLFYYLKEKDIIKTKYYSGFINSKFLLDFIYEENIKELEYTYIISKGKWERINGYFFSTQDVNNYIKVIEEYKNRKKHPGSFALRSLQRRIREKYGDNSLSHLYSYGNKSMVYMIENNNLIDPNLSQPKRYIGIWKKTNSDNYVCSGILVFQDILKYGPQKFTKKILFSSNNYDDVKKNESFYISEFKTNQKQREGEGHWGYNQTDGGDSVTFSSPVLIFDYKTQEKSYFPSMKEAEDILSLSKGSLSGHVSRNKRNNGIPYLFKNRYYCMYQSDEDLFDEKINELKNKGRFDVVEPVLEICPFTMKILNQFENSNSASIALTGSSKIGGDIRLLCKGETNAMVKNSLWIFEKDKSNLKNIFHSFHSSRKQKMVKRINIESNEIDYFYYAKEAARSINSNSHMIKNLILNGRVYDKKYKFEYVE